MNYNLATDHTLVVKHILSPIMVFVFYNWYSLPVSHIWYFYFFCYASNKVFVLFFDFASTIYSTNISLYNVLNAFNGPWKFPEFLTRPSSKYIEWFWTPPLYIVDIPHKWWAWNTNIRIIRIFKSSGFE